MRINGNTVLITGGATGIGLGLAEELVNAGNEVIICGRREGMLKEAKRKIPKLHTKVCDVSDEEDRKELADWILSGFKDMNILINNAGIQRRVDYRTGRSNTNPSEDEIDINLKAPIRLCEIFIPHLMQKKEAAIVNVTSGLGFSPAAAMPVYCATKAALHSFTMSLRHQLRDTPIKVFELIPPAVETDLHKGARERGGQRNMNIITVKEFVVPAMEALKNDEYEKAVGMAEGIMMGARKNPEEIFKRMNQR